MIDFLLSLAQTMGGIIVAAAIITFALRSQRKEGKQ